MGNLHVELVHLLDHQRLVDRMPLRHDRISAVALICRICAVRSLSVGWYDAIDTGFRP